MNKLKFSYEPKIETNGNKYQDEILCSYKFRFQILIWKYQSQDVFLQIPHALIRAICFPLSGLSLLNSGFLISSRLLKLSSPRCYCISLKKSWKRSRLWLATYKVNWSKGKLEKVTGKRYWGENDTKSGFLSRFTLGFYMWFLVRAAWHVKICWKVAWLWPYRFEMFEQANLMIRILSKNHTLQLMIYLQGEMVSKSRPSMLINQPIRMFIGSQYRNCKNVWGSQCVHIENIESWRGMQAQADLCKKLMRELEMFMNISWWTFSSKFARKCLVCKGKENIGGEFMAT